MTSGEQQRPKKNEKMGNYDSKQLPYRKNIIVIGLVLGKLYCEILIPILAPDPVNNMKLRFLNYPIYVGGNRGGDIRK